jgi:glycosyltransferase involved in cell wall biosynthesis
MMPAAEEYSGGMDDSWGATKMGADPRSRHPRLSVVINNYNYARYLNACIDSILSQAEADVEIVVVDDGSKDGSLDVLRKYGSRIRIIAQENGGQASAMNSGVAAASGDILLMMDADDVLLPGKIAAMRRVFGRIAPDRPVCLTHRFNWIDRDGAPVRRASWTWRDRLSRLLHPAGLHRVMTVQRAVAMITRYGYLPWPCQTRTSMLCLNRAMADRVFPIPTDGGRICADEFVVRGCLLSGDFYCLERALTAYRDHGGNGWLHAQGAGAGSGFYAVLRRYLTERYRAAGGTAEVDPEHAVITYVYVREELPVIERLRSAWRRSPRDLQSLGYLSLLVAKRSPHWLGRRAMRSLGRA